MTRPLERPRIFIPCGHQNAQSIGQYMRPGGRAQYSSTLGTAMNRSGSIVSVASCVEVTSHTVNGTIITHVQINGSDVFLSTSQTITGVGSFSWSDTQDRGIDTFSVDDLIMVKVLRESGMPSYNWFPVIVVEVELDD